MQIVARVEQLDEISPDDFRLRSRTKVFESTATIEEIHTWAQTIGNYSINEIALTAAE